MLPHEEIRVGDSLVSSGTPRGGRRGYRALGSRRTLRVFESESGVYRDFGFSSYEDAEAAQDLLIWLDPEPCVGSAIVEGCDIAQIMKSWQESAGRPLKKYRSDRQTYRPPRDG